MTECLHWCVLTKTHNGTVALLRGISEVEAQEVAARLCPPRPSGMYHVHDSDIDQIEVFHAGPLCED